MDSNEGVKRAMAYELSKAIDDVAERFALLHALDPCMVERNAIGWVELDSPEGPVPVKVLVQITTPTEIAKALAEAKAKAKKAAN